MPTSITPPPPPPPPPPPLPPLLTHYLIFLYPQTYTSPSIPPDTYTSLPYPMLSEPASIAVNITLSSLTLPPICETIVDLVLELGELPTRRPRAPRICIVLHPSAPLALFEIARDPIYQLVIYSRPYPKRNIKTPSYETH